MSKTILSAERLRELLDYDPETGIFKWRTATSPRVKAGSVAGGKNADGYIQIQIGGVLYTAHRLALMHVEGKWPDCQEVDHRNGDRADNRLSNLRKCDKAGNQQNQRRARADNSSGFLGVSRHRRGWQASIRTNGHRKYLGLFETPEGAHHAYLAAKRALHEGCTL